MPGSRFIIFVCIVFVIVVVGLFLELSYNKNHATMVFVVPQRLIVIKAKELKCDDDVIVYNSKEVSLDEALKKVPKSKRGRYMEQPIETHLSRKISKPFNDSYNDIKEGFGGSMPVSLVLKAATGIADLTHSLTSESDNSTPYRLLSSNEHKWTAFIDENNVYLK